MQPKCHLDTDPISMPDPMKKTRSSESSGWMKKVDGDKYLHDLSIPGTHDTMSWHVTRHDM